jgi:DNA mismatch repair protein MutS2
MNRHALDVIEFPRALALVAGRATSAPGRDRVLALLPHADRPALEAEHARVEAVRGCLTSEGGWTPQPVPELQAPVARLRVAGAHWSGPELLAGALLLASSRLTREALRDPRLPAAARAELAPLVDRLLEARGPEQAIGRAIEADGLLKDDASPALRRLRRDLRGAQGELIALLERIVSRLASHQQVADMSVTLRNGRYVIPVRREARGAVGGIVHDTSTTGATLFVEPPAAVEFGNHIREMEIEEAREVDRILLELTDGLRPLAPALAEALDVLAELDALCARARFALDFQCAPVLLAAAGEGFSIRDGRHPLLLAHGDGTAVVPFDLEMEPRERTLLVSGPNTGGKTVLLKAIGLMSALVQAGIPAPAGAGSRIAVFDDLFADIGDEQSIEASLSTFSAHLRHLSEILRRCTDRSLALIDELGSGTDPVEGAALGGAILETLTRRGTMTIATTHLGALKELAGEPAGAGIVNASLQFDEVALAPTYRLIKGIPGRSYGLGIARRLKVPDDVLARAEERLPAGERDLTALLAELERRKAGLESRERLADELVTGGQAHAARVAEREARVRERERALERDSRREARRHLLDARAEVERTIRDLRTAGAEAREAGEEAAREARRRMERLAHEHEAALDRLDAEESAAAAGPAPTADAPGPPAVGDRVELGTMGGRTGRLLELRDEMAVVAVGVMKMSVPVSSLRATRRREEPLEAAVAIRGDLPDEVVASEIDLRGMRLDEIDEPVLRAVDAAARADLPALRIIHGKGTGALRERVGELLRTDSRVRHVRLGAWNEGGAGVTVAEFS